MISEYEKNYGKTKDTKRFFLSICVTSKILLAVLLKLIVRLNGLGFEFVVLQGGKDIKEEEDFAVYHEFLTLIRLLFVFLTSRLWIVIS